MSTETQHPPVPAGDFLLYRDGRYASYGPRVERDGVVGPPDSGQEAQFWGVYARTKDGKRWEWYADVPTLRTARVTAEAALFAVLQ
jgi:hypothetical protein